MTSIILENMLSPAVMLFSLGLLAAWLGNPLKLPEAFSQGLTQFLLIAIGFKGGLVIAQEGLVAEAWWLIIAGVLLSFCMPVLGYLLLRYTTRLAPADAAVVAAHYGSVSVVTFMAAVSYLQLQGDSFSGHMVVIMVVMEVPAVISGIWLARRVLPKAEASSEEKRSGEPLNLLNNGSIFLLLGSMFIGFTARGEGQAQLESFLLTPMYGVLCLFLLDLGLKAGRQFSVLRTAGAGLPIFGLVMPMIGGILGLASASLIGLSVANATLLAVLAASASYIVVPAAMRMAVPEANSIVGTTLSMGVTFPFNIIVGIPLYYAAANFFLSA